MFAETAVQLKQIERGVAEIFPHEDLVSKLEKSRRENRPLRIKLGIDPTSSDIHLGHAVPLNKLKHFQDLGHQVVLIIGDYTAMVGDPSGRDATRPQLAHEAVMKHAQTYLDQVGKILDRSRTEVVYNGDWFSKMTFLDVIRLAAKMTVARILERDDFLKRYKAGEPISLHEFMYPVMQGHDSVMVRADVEIGGTDQKFNLLVGRQFQKDAGQEPQVAMTLPLLVGTDGVQKMSKSYGNYIGISEPPGVMFGKTMSVPDALLRSYFDLATRPAGGAGGTPAGRRPDAGQAGAGVRHRRTVSWRGRRARGGGPVRPRGPPQGSAGRHSGSARAAGTARRRQGLDRAADRPLRNGRQHQRGQAPHRPGRGLHGWTGRHGFGPGSDAASRVPAQGGKAQVRPGDLAGEEMT